MSHKILNALRAGATEAGIFGALGATMVGGLALTVSIPVIAAAAYGAAVFGCFRTLLGSCAKRADGHNRYAVLAGGVVATAVLAAGIHSFQSLEEPLQKITAEMHVSPAFAQSAAPGTSAVVQPATAAHKAAMAPG
jgi:hypothetical protein